MDKLLNMLVIFVNDGIRYCKCALETEEKSKEIAFLQGKITGYRLLLSYLKKHFSLAPTFIEDNDEKPVSLKDLSDNEINELVLFIEALKASEEWGKVVSDIDDTAKQLKSFLLHCAENARDLFISQAQYGAMLCYADLFENIIKDKRFREERANEALPFTPENAA